MSRRPNKLNPCSECHNTTKDGIVCDSCGQWRCLGCINVTVKNTCSAALYKRLCDIGEFPYQCEKCDQHLLPFQLVQNNLFSREDLVNSFHINLAALAYNGNHEQARKEYRQRYSSESNPSAKSATASSSATSDASSEQLKTLVDVQLEIVRLLKLQPPQAPTVPAAAPPAPGLTAQDISNAIAAAVTATMQATGAAAPAAPVNLPALPQPPSHRPTPLASFSGDILHFDSWWESFSLNFDSNVSISDRHKLDALRNLLRGPALAKIDGLGISGAAYQEAVATLKANYADKQAQLDAARNALSNLPSVKADFSNLERVADEFTNLCHKLKRFGADDAVIDEHANLLLQKLPQKLQMWVREKRIDQGHHQQPLTQKDLLDLLLRARLLFCKECQPQGQPRKERQKLEDNSETDEMPMPTANFMNAAGAFRSHHNQNRYPTQGQRNLQSQTHRQRPHQMQQKPRPHPQTHHQQNPQQQPRNQQTTREPGRHGCIFCLYNNFYRPHRSEDCRAVTSIDERWHIVKQVKACFLCLQQNCSVRSCQANGPCRFGKPHHKALCNCGDRIPPRRFQGNQPQLMINGNDADQGQDAYNDRKYCSYNERQPLTAATDTTLTTDAVNEAQIALTAAVKPATTPTTGVVMATFPVKIANTATGATATTGLFIDQGATFTTMSWELAQKLRLPVIRKTTLTISCYNEQLKKKVPADLVKVTIKTNEGELADLLVYAVETLAPSVSLNPLILRKETLVKLKKRTVLNLPPRRKTELSLGIVLGNDYWHQLMMSKLCHILHLESTLFLYETCLGDIICGAVLPDDATVTTTAEEQPETTTMLAITEAKPDMLWKLDVLGIEPDKTTTLKTDEEVLEEFKKTTYKEGNRYWVKMPFKTETPTLSTNFNQAASRLEQMIKTKKPEDIQRYHDIFTGKDGYEDRGYVEKVTWKSDNNSLIHYLSHFMVLNPQSKTTPARPVFDASAKGKGGVSLNDCLYAGGKTLHDLAGILIRLRLHKFLIIGDIQKAYYQCGLQECCRDSCRFLLLKDPTKLTLRNNLQVLRFCRVVMGSNCGSFLLGATINLHLDNERKRLLSSNDSNRDFLLALVDHLEDNIYCDNVHVGFNDSNDGYKCYQGIKAIMSGASMPVKEFTTNNIELKSAMADEDKTTDEAVKLLGLTFSTDDDFLQLSPIRRLTKPPLTRRKVVSVNNSLFDILGFACPVSIRGKLFIQKLDSSSSSWDKPLSPELESEWHQIESDLRQLHQVRIPRWVPIKLNRPVRLVCFCDASPLVAAACVIIHQSPSPSSSSASSLSSSTDDIITQLVFAKARVMPRDDEKKPKFTLPRHELISILIGCRATKYVRSQLKVPIESVTVFSDSMIALSWIRSSKTLRPYEQRRCEEIRSSGVDEFLFIRSEFNHIDQATRGISFQEFMNSTFHSGPSWLRQPRHLWPKWEEEPSQPSEPTTPSSSGSSSTSSPSPPSYPVSLSSSTSTSSQVSSSSVSHPSDTASITQASATGLSAVSNDPKSEGPDSEFPIDIRRFNCIEKLLRVTIYVLHFLRLMHPPINPIPPTPSLITSENMSFAESWWVSKIQSARYKRELELLDKGKRNELIRQLDLHIGHSGLLCVGGRIADAKISEKAKFPCLLPKEHRFSALIVKRAHEDCFHFGEKMTLCKIRSSGYWISRPTGLVRQIIKNCMICRRSEAGPFRAPKMGQLPPDRLHPAPIFSSCALDYLGPLLIKTNKGEPPKKRWIALFTDPVVRCIHLEVVPDCTSGSALRAIERFAARRSMPTTLFRSDNATTFVGASKALEEIWDKSVASDLMNKLTVFCARNRVRWRFIPPRAAFVGGFWERMVGLVKRAIKKTLWKASVSDDELHTLVVKIENAINSRPLTSISSDINDSLPLTPASFLAPGMGPGALPPIPDGEQKNDPDFRLQGEQDVLRDWKKLERRLDQYWSVFQKGYLQELREKQVTEFKRSKKESDWIPNPGSTVLLMETTPRTTWKMALVTKHILGSDGFVRFVEIRLPSGQVTSRSIQHLCPLETNLHQSDQETSNVKTINSVQPGSPVKPGVPVQRPEDGGDNPQPLPSARDQRAQRRAKLRL